MHTSSSLEDVTKSSAPAKNQLYVPQEFPASPVVKIPHCISKAGGPDLIPGQGTGSHMPQLKVLHVAMKIKDPMCHTKTWHCQINELFKF